MRSILVGDPHVQISNLDESKILMDRVYRIAVEKKAENIVLLGDLFHNHDVIRARVLDFWIDTLEKSPVPVIIVVGNHDMVGSKELEGKVSAPNALSKISNVKVFNSPGLAHGHGFIPYRHSKEEFLSAVKELSSKTSIIFCHQTFDTACFENGFYAPDGVKLEDLPPGIQIISGHIHAQQEIKNESNNSSVWYPGTPRWLTASDANSKKGLWVYDSAGVNEFIDLSDTIPPMVRISLLEGQTLGEVPKTSPDRVFIDLIGSSLWIKEVKKTLPEGAKVTSKITDQGKKQKRSTKKKNIADFIDEDYTPVLVSKEDLKQFLIEVGL